MIHRFHLLLLLFSVGIEGSAQGMSIDYGTNLTARINQAGDRHQYTFYGEADDRILLRMKGTKYGVDACFELYSSGGSLLAGDCADGRLATIKDFRLPEDGTYTLWAQDHKNNDTGDYGLSLQVLNKTGHATAYQCGSDARFRIDHLAGVDAYTFSASAGSGVLLQMRGELENIEAILELYDQEGELIERATPVAGLSRIGAVTLAQGGDYLLLAMDENGNDLGDYFMDIYQFDDSNCTVPTGCGAHFSAGLDHPAEIDAYVFDATVGDVFVAHMRGADNSIEPLLELYGPDGEWIGVNERVGRLGKFPATGLNKTGQYVLLAMDAQGNDAGAYSISFQFTNAYLACSVPLHCSNLGDIHRLSRDAEIDAFTFYAEAGERIQINLQEIDPIIEPRFELYAPDGEQVITASSGQRAEKEMLLPDAGDYTLLVMDYEGNDQGRYSINIEGGNVIKDILPPVAACKSLTLLLDDSGMAQLTPEDIDDGSTDDCGIVGRELSKSSFNCEDIGTQVIEYQIFDGGGNLSICELLLTIEDPDGHCGWNYCPSYAESTDFEWIEKVTIGSIDNRSGDDGGYGDYTDLIAEININSTRVIEFSPGFANPSNPLRECWGVWIDLNQDGDFEDTGELMLQSSGYGINYGSIQIPSYAAIGATRLRIAMNYEAYPSPCGSYNFGETEDYTVVLLPQAICGGLPDGWSHLNIGQPEKPGSDCYLSADPSFVISAAGKGIDDKEEVLPGRRGPSPGDTSGRITEGTAGLKRVSPAPVVYPNPATEYVRIEFPEALSGLKEISVYNALGRLVWQQKAEGIAAQIDLQPSRFLSGQYWIRVVTHEEEVSLPLLIVR